jgi:hypothetical protein
MSVERDPYAQFDNMSNEAVREGFRFRDRKIQALEDRIKVGLVGLGLLADNCPCGGKGLEEAKHVTNCLVLVIAKKLKEGHPES